MSSKKPRERFKFVVDEDLGKSYWNVINECTHFDSSEFTEYWSPGVPDAVWIPEIVKHNVIVITHDRRMRRQHRNVVVANNARIIVSVGPVDFEGQARALTASWPTVERFLRKHEAPFIARFSRPTGKELKKIKPRGRIVLDDYFR